MTKRIFSALAALALLAACDPEMNEVPATSITFDEPAVTMKVGETKTLTVTVEPENTTDKVEWECLMPENATVENGVVTALQEGFASIVAKAGEVQATCRIFIEADGDEESFVIEPAPVTLAIDEEAELTAVMKPSGTKVKVEWKCDKPDVVALGAINDSQAKIQGQAAGKATVTAYASDGKTATCEVTVEGGTSIVAVTSITLDRDKLEMTVGQKDTLVATVLPENATYKTALNWSVMDNRIVTVGTNGELTAVSAGTTTVTVISVMHPTVMASCEVTVSGPKAPRYFFQTSDNYGQAKLYVDGKQFGTSTTVAYANNEGTDIWYYASDGFYKENQKVLSVNRESLGDGQYHVFNGFAVKNGLLHYVYTTFTSGDYRMYFRTVDLSNGKVFENKLNETPYAQTYTTSANGKSICVTNNGKVYIPVSVRLTSYWTTKVLEITPATETSDAVITEHVLFEGSSNLTTGTYDIANGEDGSVYTLVHYQDKSESKDEMVLFKDFQEVRRYEGYNYGNISIDGTDVYLFMTRTDNSTCDVFKNADIVKGPLTNVYQRNGCVAADGNGGYYYAYTKLVNNNLAGYLYDSGSKQLFQLTAMIIRLQVAK